METNDDRPVTVRAALFNHQTTIIAIILAIATIIGGKIESLEDAANEMEQAIQEEREFIEMERQSIHLEKEDLQAEADSSDENYQERMTNYARVEDSLASKEKELMTQENEQEEVLATQRSRDNYSDGADTIFSISVLLSSIGESTRKRPLQLTSLLLAVVGLGMLIMIPFL